MALDDSIEDRAMAEYCREGEKKAMALGNRGPIRFDKNGKLHPEIAEAYDRCGFYVFENVISANELRELETDFHDMMDRMPTSPDSKVDRHGRPALGSDSDAFSVVWAKPLGDPFGGTTINKGRHEVKMYEPKAASTLPEKVVAGLLGLLQFSDAALRLYAHPDLLRVAAAVNGDDFTPFTEAIAIKKPGEGPSVSWHQDGMTHWDNPNWDPGIHGFNFMTQLYNSTAANGVWYLPGTQKLGKVNIKAIMEKSGTDRLLDAVPLIAKPGDVCISNRQVVHGSFANTSKDWRVTFTIGFQRRSSVLGATGKVFGAKEQFQFDEKIIHDRAAMIGYAIDARRRHWPDESPFVYKPHADAGETYSWNDAARAASRGYQKSDLTV